MVVGGLALSYPFVVAQFHVSYAVLGVVITIAGLLGGLLQGTAGPLRRMSARVIVTAQDAAMAGAFAVMAGSFLVAAAVVQALVPGPANG